MGEAASMCETLVCNVPDCMLQHPRKQSPSKETLLLYRTTDAACLSEHEFKISEGISTF
jgi:hypothetical protein